MLNIIYLFRDISIPSIDSQYSILKIRVMSSHSYPKILIKSPSQARSDNCYSSISGTDGPRAIQWNMLAFIDNVIPIRRKILGFLWHLQFIQI